MFLASGMTGFLGSYAYIDTIINGNLGHAWRYCLNLSPPTQTENFNWHGGSIASCNNPANVVFATAPTSSATSGTLLANWTGATSYYPVKFSDGEIQPILLTNGATTANWATYGAALTGNPTATATTSLDSIAIYMASITGAYASLNLFGVSLDYSDQLCSNNGGRIGIYGGHVEDNHYQNILCTLTEPASSSNVGVYMDPIELVLYDGSQNTGGAGVPRPSIFSCSGHVFVKSRTDWEIGNSAATFFNPTKCSGSLSVSLAGSSINAYGPNYPNISGLIYNANAVLNPLLNSGFESDNFSGWSNTGNSSGSSGWITTIDSSNPHSGTYAAKIIVSTGSGGIVQAVPVSPGEQLIYTAYVDVTAYTSGTLDYSVYWMDQTCTTQLSVSNAGAYVATTGGYVLAYQSIIVPPNAACALIGLSSGNFQGTAYFDDATAEAF